MRPLHFLVRLGDKRFRNLRHGMNLGTRLKHKQYKDKKVRNGTPQYYSSACKHRGGCTICEGNRLYKYRKWETEYDSKGYIA